MGYENVGKCSNCWKEFNYVLLHNGFNDSSYAYCDTCGRTAILSGWFNGIPEKTHLKLHQKISADVEPFLKPCICGGTFTHSASPRCPHCRMELSAIEAAEYIEKNAPGTTKGWRWQRNWSGLYCIAIRDYEVANNWK